MITPDLNKGAFAFSRREWLAAIGAAAALNLSRDARPCFACDAPPAAPAGPANRYKIAACDWMMLKRQKLGAIQLAKDVGLDGVEVDIGGLGDRPAFDNKLRDPNVRRQFLDAAKSAGIEFCSLAMSAFYAQSFP